MLFLVWNFLTFVIFFCFKDFPKFKVTFSQRVVYSFFFFCFFLYYYHQFEQSFYWHRKFYYRNETPISTQNKVKPKVFDVYANNPSPPLTKVEKNLWKKLNVIEKSVEKLQTSTETNIMQKKNSFFVYSYLNLSFVLELWEAGPLVAVIRTAHFNSQLYGRLTRVRRMDDCSEVFVWV